MKYPLIKSAAVLGVAATLMASVAEPASARNRWVGPAVGFAAGVAVGSAVANSRAYYNDPYYGGYAYGRPYSGYDAYAYEPAYVAPAYPGYYGYSPTRRCNPDTNSGRIDAGC